MLLTGDQAFDSGYKDQTGQGGNYALGMLGSVQNDRLGLSFNLGAFDFFNFKIDVSSLGLHSGPGGHLQLDSTFLYSNSRYSITLLGKRF